MKYTIKGVEFLDINQSKRLSELKDEIKRYFIQNTDWEFLRLPCLFSKSTMLKFLNQNERDESICIFPPTKKSVEYYLNSERLIGSFIEAREGTMLSYKDIPKKFILDTILTTFNKKEKNFYSDYNNLSFAIIIKEENTSVIVHIEKEIRKHLSRFVRKESIYLLRKKHRSLRNILKCRDKNNSILPLEAIFYVLPEKDIALI